MSVFTTTESAAIQAALDTLKDEVNEATVTENLDPLMPTPFTPASDALERASESFIPSPYSDAEVKVVQERVLEAAIEESRGAQIGTRANLVITKLIDFIPLLFG